jgi:hypothetical protein
MNKALLVSMLLLLACAAGASERRGMQVLEDGREVEAGTLTLPTQSSGTLEFRGCTVCATIALGLDLETRFYIGRREVSLGELRSYVNAHPSAAVLIVTPRTRNNVVSRIVAQPLGQ